jgi:hypothetical protein
VSSLEIGTARPPRHGWVKVAVGTATGAALVGALPSEAIDFHASLGAVAVVGVLVAMALRR